MKSIKANLVTPVPSADLPPAPSNPEARKARCLDPNWKFVKPESTDIAKTFARIRKQLKENEAALHKAAENVCDLKRKATK